MGAFAYLFPILGLASYGFALLFNYGAVAGKWFGDLGVGDVSDKYNVSITPSGWTFSIWGIIYTWQALLLIYLIYLSFKSINKGKLYFTKLFWVSYIASNIFNGIWIAVWISEQITLAMIVLLLIFISLFIAGLTSHLWLVYELPFELSQNRTESELDVYPQSLILSLKRVNQSCCMPCCCNDEKQLLYWYVLNGIPLYATWTTLASSINISVFLRYVADLSNDSAVGVGLTFLIVCILGYWFCDFVKFRNTLRFTFTPYFVLIWAFLGVLTNYSVSEYTSSVVILVLLIAAVIATIYKVFDSVRLIKANNGNLHLSNFCDLSHLCNLSSKNAHAYIETPNEHENEKNRNENVFEPQISDI